MMGVRKDLDMDPVARLMKNEDELSLLINQAVTSGRNVVLTQGTFDLIHIGHARYLRAAKENGDLLIVGVDDDEKARGRKGENRPVVPLIERAEMLGHLRYVDAIVVKKANDPHWHLIKFIKPNVLIAVEGTYSPDELEELKEFCDEVRVLPRQANTSTSAQVRTLVLDGADTLKRIIVERIPEFIEEVYHDLRKEK